MATQPPQTAGSATGRPELVTAALDVHKLVDDKPYKWGGHTTAGFDCSGFVIYTLKQAYPNTGWTFITAAQIFADGRFEEVSGPPRPGDLIGFRRSKKGVDHVGIVLDDPHWIGSQSSTGVEKVRHTNPYWSGRSPFYLRLK